MIDRGRIIEPLPLPSPRAERRRFPRHPIARACKIRPEGAIRFVPATTADASAGGALVTIDADRPFTLGERVVLAVAWDGMPTITHGQHYHARVVRVIERDGRRALALAFDHPIAAVSTAPNGRAA